MCDFGKVIHVWDVEEIEDQREPEWLRGLGIPERMDSDPINVTEEWPVRVPVEVE